MTLNHAICSKSKTGDYILLYGYMRVHTQNDWDSSLQLTYNFIPFQGRERIERRAEIIISPFWTRYYLRSDNKDYLSLREVQHAKSRGRWSASYCHQTIDLRHLWSVLNRKLHTKLFPFPKSWGIPLPQAASGNSLAIPQVRIWQNSDSFEIPCRKRRMWFDLRKTPFLKDFTGDARGFISWTLVFMK